LSSQLAFNLSKCQLLKGMFAAIICILTKLWWNIDMDDWNLDEISLSYWQYHQSIVPKRISQAMTNIMRLKISVGDGTPYFTISIEQDNYLTLFT
jgi:hypothetical protein